MTFSVASRILSDLVRHAGLIHRPIQATSSSIG